MTVKQVNLMNLDLSKWIKWVKEREMKVLSQQCEVLCKHCQENSNLFAYKLLLRFASLYKNLTTNNNIFLMQFLFSQLITE